MLRQDRISAFLFLTLIWFLPIDLLAQPNGNSSVSPQVLNRTLAQVSDRVITSRQVILAQLFERWLLVHSRQDLAKSKSVSKPSKTSVHEAPLIEGTENFSKQLGQVILEEVVVLEAESFKLGEVDSKQATDLTNEFRKELQTSPESQKLAFSDQELELVVDRHLKAQSFLRFKVKSAGVLPTDDDIRDYYEKNKFRFGGQPLSLFKDNIRDFLSQRFLEEKLKDWYELLKRKYHVRYLQPQNL